MTKWKIFKKVMGMHWLNAPFYLLIMPLVVLLLLLGEEWYWMVLDVVLLLGGTVLLRWDIRSAKVELAQQETPEPVSDDYGPAAGHQRYNQWDDW